MTMSSIDSQASLAIAQAQSTRTLSEAAKNYENAKTEQDLHRIKEAAQQFESVFIYEMMKPMFESVDIDPMFGGGKGEEIFRGFLNQEYGKNVAEKGGLGLQSAIMDSLIKAQAEKSGQ